MKIKVDKKEYEELLKKVDDLSKYICDIQKEMDYERKRMARWLPEYIDEYFTEKCRVVLVKRDKDQIIAELKNDIMNNLFKRGKE